MLRTNVGLTLLLISAIIYSSVLISASNYSQVLVHEAIGWDGRYGIFGTAFREIGTVPLTISIVLAVAGLIIVVISRGKD